MKTYNPSITLLQGCETERTFKRVLGETRIKSEPLVAALKSHFVDGMSASMAYGIAGLSQQGFERGVKALNKAYRKLESDVNVNTTKDIA